MERYTLCGLIIILSLGGNINSEPDAQLKFKAHQASTDGKDNSAEHVLLQPATIPLNHDQEKQMHIIVQRMEEPSVEIRMIHHDTHEEMDFDTYYSMLKEEAAQHVQTVANDSKKQETLKLEASPAEPEHKPEAEVVRELPGTAQRLRDENILKADDHKSEGSNEQDDSKDLTHIYMKPIPPPVDPEDLPDIIVHHQEDEEFVHKIVYVHTDRHEHVVHKGRNYATLMYHDEM